MKTGNSELGVSLSETVQSCSGRTSLSLGAALPTTLGLPDQQTSRLAWSFSQMFERERKRECISILRPPDSFLPSSHSPPLLQQKPRSG